MKRSGTRMLNWRIRREGVMKIFKKKRSHSDFGLSVTSVNRVVYVQNETPTTLKDACCGAE